MVFVNLNLVFFSCSWQIFGNFSLIREVRRTWCFQHKESPLDAGLLVLPVECVIEVVIVKVVVTSDSRDGSRSSSLLTMLRPSLTDLIDLI